LALRFVFFAAFFLPFFAFLMMFLLVDFFCRFRRRLWKAAAVFVAGVGCAG